MTDSDQQREEHGQQVLLKGGPCDGMRVRAVVCKPWVQSRSLLMEDAQEPGLVARYRPSRTKGVYTFREYDRVVASLPAPEVEASRTGGDG